MKDITKMSFQQKYDVIGIRPSEYEGMFFTAVKTTGIFCRPSCSARKPNIENVVFYDTSAQALAHGFRPCKVCRPMEFPGETPNYIQQLIADIHKNPHIKIADQDLRNRGIEPATLRRWFKKHHHMTFQAYQRMLRIGNAYSSITGGESITHTATRFGYENLNRLNENSKNIFGVSSKNIGNKNIIHMVRFTTPLGPMFACATQKGLCLLEFVDRRALENEFKDLCKRLDAVILPGDNIYLDMVQKQFGEYLDRKRKTFDIPLDTPGTTFQQSVWKELGNIKFGETRSYKQQAIALGKPNAVRAVANANGCNRIAILIPCHRVIGSDGSLTGYGGGLARKKYFLDLEQEVM